MTWTKFTGGFASGNGITSLPVTSATAVNVGDTICCAITWDTSGGATSGSITDSLGNTYTSGARILGATNGQAVETFYCIVTHAGTPTVTLKFNPTPDTSDASGVEFLVDIFTGSDATAAVDGTGSANEQVAPGTGTDAITSGTWTTTHDGCLIYCATVDEASGGNSQTEGTGFSPGSSDNNVLWLGSEYGTQSAHGSVAGTWTTSSGGDNFVTAAFAIAPTSGGGGGGTATTQPAYRQPVPMRPGSSGLTKGKPFEFSKGPPVPPVVPFVTPNTPPAFVNHIPMRPGPMGLARGQVFAFATDTPVPPVPPTIFSTTTLPFVFTIPRVPMPGGIVLGAPFAFATSTPVARVSGTRRRNRLIT